HLSSLARFHRRLQLRSQRSQITKSFLARKYHFEKSPRISRAIRFSSKRRRNPWPRTFAWNRICKKQIHPRTFSQRTKYRRKNPPSHAPEKRPRLSHPRLRRRLARRPHPSRSSVHPHYRGIQTHRHCSRVLFRTALPIQAGLNSPRISVQRAHPPEQRECFAVIPLL